MRKVLVDEKVEMKLFELETYLKDELKMSTEAALKRSLRMRKFVISLTTRVDYPLCRFKHWREQGYRCAVFEHDWVFAYEVFDEGIIIRDMSHTALLKQ